MVYLKKIVFYFIAFVFLISGCAVPEKKVSWQRKKYDQDQKISGRTEIKSAVMIDNTAIPAEPLLPKPAVKEVKIKIGIVQSSRSIDIGGSSGGILVVDAENGNIFELPGGGIYRAVVASGKLSFAGRLFRSGIKIISNAGNDGLIVNGRKYRGDILLIRANYGITAINETGIEEYVCGVITEEISASWHVESIKAQAVVARTYAVKNAEKHKNEGFGLCNKQHCQMYGGMNAEDPVSNKAVYDTAGEILCYDGKVADTFYHSSCGGRTEDANKVWQLKNEIPNYMKGIKCGFCETEPLHNWESRISLSSVASALRAAGLKIKKIKNIQTSGRTSSGRVRYVLIKNTGTTTLSSHKFRMMIGTDIIKSTNFNLTVKNGIAYFAGHGWGHGVGMCQWGAKGLAENGREYKNILKYYYEGCEIGNYE